MGVLVDRIGARGAGIIGQLIVIAALLGAWQIGIASLGGALLLGLFLGVAGASFAVSLPLASRWYPPQHQGTAMGIAGAGNSGTVLAACLPRRWRWPLAGRTCSAWPAFRCCRAAHLHLLCQGHRMRRRPRSWPTIWRC
jgi:nitrate/nitrite transporter NarK